MKGKRLVKVGKKGLAFAVALVLFVGMGLPVSMASDEMELPGEGIVVDGGDVGSDVLEGEVPGAEGETQVPEDDLDGVLLDENEQLIRATKESIPNTGGQSYSFTYINYDFDGNVIGKLVLDYPVGSKQFVMSPRQVELTNFDESGDFSPPFSVEEKYYFDCWTDEDGNRYNTGDIITVDQKIALQAVWMVVDDMFEVIYYNHGAGEEPQSLGTAFFFYEEDKIQILPLDEVALRGNEDHWGFMVPEGMVFSHWLSLWDEETKYYPGDVVDLADYQYNTIELCAVFVEGYGVVYYNFGPGVHENLLGYAHLGEFPVGTEIKVLTPGEAAAMAMEDDSVSNFYNPDGMVFSHWSTDNEKAEPAVEPGDVLKIVDGPLEFWAIWKDDNSGGETPGGGNGGGDPWDGGDGGSTTITDPQVPQAELPEVEIEDGEVPLAELPTTGGSNMKTTARVAVGSSTMLLVSAGMVLFKKRRMN